jgi:hypothetical protein
MKIECKCGGGEGTDNHVYLIGGETFCSHCRPRCKCGEVLSHTDTDIPCRKCLKKQGESKYE